MPVVCPECGKSLQLKGELKPGKRIRCPKCDAVFAPAVDVVDEVEEVPDDAIQDRPRRKAAPIRAAARDDRDDDDRDERDDRDDDDDYDRRPRKRKRSKKKSGSSSGLIWGIVAGVVGLLVVIIVVVVLLLVRGGGGAAQAQHEEAMKEALQTLTDLENAMREVRDPASAKVAAVKVNQVCDRLEALGRKVQALPKLPVAQAQQLQNKYKPQVDAINGRMAQVGFQAGQNSRGEASFVAAAQRLMQVGLALQRLGI